jgi:signal transduction histidine kinase
MEEYRMNLNNIKIKIIILIFLTLIPLSLLKVYEIQNRYQQSIESELNSSEELASVIAGTFSTYIEGIWTTRKAMGMNILSNEDWNKKDIEDYLQITLSTDPRIIGSAWLSPKGEVIASTRRIAAEKNYRDQEYIKEIIDGSVNTISNLTINDGILLISAAKGIRKNNELGGIIIVQVDVKKIGSVFKAERVGNTSSYGIIDKNGHIVYRKGSEQLSFESRRIEENSPAWAALEGEIVRTKTFKSRFGDNPRMGVSYPIETLGWASFVTTNKAELLAKNNRVLNTEILIFASIFIISFLLALRLSNKLVSSINKLVKTSKEIMNGNFNAKNNFSDDNSLAIIGQTFDQMTEALHQRMKEMEEYSQLKAQFLATVSHELKTPLNIILSSNQLMEQLDCDNRECWNIFVKKYLKMQKQNCYRLLRLINNLIDISKAEGSHLKVQLANEDIVKVVEDITLSIVDYAVFKNIEIIFDTEIEEKVIALDQDMIERIMLNLLSNAIKYTGPGGKVWVSIYDREERIAVSVKDNGIGIPEDKKGIIFERFVQVDNTLSRQAEGSGIGLSLVKYLVELHEGKISVVSELGKGSEFIIELPVKLTSNESTVSNGKEFSNVERIKIEFSDIYLDSNKEEATL